MKIKNSLAGIIAFAALIFTSFSHAGVDVEVDENGVILAGHDAVAYFTENAAVEGSSRFTSSYNDAIYYFKSAENRDTFNDNPEKYAPQYGGFCAYGTTFSKKLEVNGKAFEVVDGKLYVNKSLNVYETWLEEKDQNIIDADEKWVVIKDIPINEL